MGFAEILPRTCLLIDFAEITKFEIRLFLKEISDSYYIYNPHMICDIRYVAYNVSSHHIIRFVWTHVEPVLWGWIRYP